MTDIRTLAATLAEKHDISEDAAKAALLIYAEQADITAELDTEIGDEDADFLTGAIAAGIEVGDVGAPDLLADLAETVAAVRAAENAVTGAVAERDGVIRRAVELGVRIADIADMAGMSVQRVYQIRDGRR